LIDNVSSPQIVERKVWSILGLPFDEVNLEDSVEHLYQDIERSNKCFLSTPNLNFAITTQSDDAFFQSVIDSDLSVADGMPLIWVAKLLGIPLTERVAGSTLFEQLSQRQKHDKKIRVFFFGGQAGIAEIAHHNLNATSQGMMSCGYYEPGFGSVDDMSSTKIITMINTAAPDFLVVALGAKKGQQWIQYNRDKLNASVISHLGAVINFVAGHIERAPQLWQQLGLEWLWRIKQEPELWKRYFFDGLGFCTLLILKILPLAIYDRWLKRTADYIQYADMTVIHSESTVITLSGSLHHEQLNNIKQAFSDVLLQNCRLNVELDFEQVVYIDSAFIATLLLFQRYLNEQGCQLYLSHLPCRIKRLLNLHNVLTRFQIR